MHIITKEQPDWTFQSLWYSPDADKLTSADIAVAGPRISVDKTFQHYLLTTTYGTTQGKGHQNYYAPPNTQPNADIWPVAYNPYIELAASHPITTNCMNCHHRAAWPPFTSQTKPDEGRASTYLQETPPNPNALEVFPETASIFNGLLTVDSMWAVSDRYPPIPMAGAKRRARRRQKRNDGLKQDEILVERLSGCKQGVI